MAAEEVAMAYALGAVERAMKVQEVILRAVDGKLTWLQAADILGRSPRSIRRLRWKLEHFGYDGLFDRHSRSARASDRKSTRLNSSHSQISYAVFCLKKKKASALTTTAKP